MDADGVPLLRVPRWSWSKRCDEGDDRNAPRQAQEEEGGKEGEGDREEEQRVRSMPKEQVEILNNDDGGQSLVLRGFQAGRVERVLKRFEWTSKRRLVMEDGEVDWIGLLQHGNSALRQLVLRRMVLRNVDPPRPSCKHIQNAASKLDTLVIEDCVLSPADERGIAPPCRHAGECEGNAPLLCLATFPLLSALAIHSHNLVLESPPHFPLRSRPLRASVRDDLFLDLMRRCTFFTTSGFSDWPAQTYDFFEVLREKKGVGLPLREWMKFLYDARQASHHSSLEAGIVTRGIAEAWWLGPGAAERKSGERIQIQELDDFVGGLRVGHVGEDDDNWSGGYDSSQEEWAENRPIRGWLPHLRRVAFPSEAPRIDKYKAVERRGGSEEAEVVEVAMRRKDLGAEEGMRWLKREE